MNISPLTIYLWQLADRFVWASCTITTILGVVSFVALVTWAVTWGNTSMNRSLGEDHNAIAPRVAQAKENLPKCKMWAVRLVSGLLFWVGLSAFLPSSNTIAMMVIIPEIAHSKVVQQDLPDIYNAAVKALKDQLAK